MRRGMSSNFWVGSFYSPVLSGNTFRFDRCEQIRICNYLLHGNLQCDGKQAQNLLTVPVSKCGMIPGWCNMGKRSRMRMWRVHRNRRCQRTTYSINRVRLLLPSRTIILIRICAHISPTPWYGWPFLLCWVITNSSSERTACRTSHTPWSAWPFLLCWVITNSSSEWTVCRVSHTPRTGCPFLLFWLITNSSYGSTVCHVSHMRL